MTSRIIAICAPGGPDAFSIILEPPPEGSEHFTAFNQKCDDLDSEFLMQPINEADYDSETQFLVDRRDGGPASFYQHFVTRRRKKKARRGFLIEEPMCGRGHGFPAPGEEESGDDVVEVTTEAQIEVTVGPAPAHVPTPAAHIVARSAVAIVEGGVTVKDDDDDDDFVEAVFVIDSVTTVTAEPCAVDAVGPSTHHRRTSHVDPTTSASAGPHGGDAASAPDDDDEGDADAGSDNEGTAVVTGRRRAEAGGAVKKQFRRRPGHGTASGAAAIPQPSPLPPTTTPAPALAKKEQHQHHHARGGGGFLSAPTHSAMRAPPPPAGPAMDFLTAPGVSAYGAPPKGVLSNPAVRRIACGVMPPHLRVGPLAPVMRGDGSDGQGEIQKQP